MTKLNFPSNPEDGDIYGNYAYSASVPGWRKVPENAASLPAGTIVQWPGATAPANWLLCQGQAVSRTTYASLFAAIGVQFGSGDGTTTFNLPDLRGRIAVGLDSSQTEFNILSKTGGAKTHTLSSSEMPSHTHTGSTTTGSSGSHTHTVTVGGGAHTHQLPMAASGAPNNTGDTPYRASGGADGNFRTGFEASGSGYGSSTGTHTHTTSVSTDGAHTHSVSFTTDSAGSSGAHNNLQPYIVLNYIIKTSAGVTSGDSELATRVGAAEIDIDALQLADSTFNKSGLVPIIPSSVAVGSGSASVNSRGTVSFSGVTTLQMNEIFSEDYDNYQMIVNVTANTATTAVQGTLVAGGVRSTSGYNNVVTVGASDNTTVTASASNASSFGTLEVHVSSNTNLGVAEILFIDPFNARRTKMPFVGTGSNAGGFFIRRNGFASHTVTDSYDGFHLNVVSGNITGTVQVYGYR